MTELLLGTKKGLFVLEGDPGSPFEISARAFAGDPVDYAVRDPRSGRVLVATTSPFYGPKVWSTDDPKRRAEALLGVREVFGDELAESAVFRELVADALARLDGAA